MIFYEKQIGNIITNKRFVTMVTFTSIHGVGLFFYKKRKLTPLQYLYLAGDKEAAVVTLENGYVGERDRNVFLTKPTELGFFFFVFFFHKCANLIPRMLILGFIIIVFVFFLFFSPPPQSPHLRSQHGSGTPRCAPRTTGNHYSE